MGFMSFNENYYKQKLEEYENRKLSEEDIYEVKQLLKVLDDLKDEGYTALNKRMENNFSCITRLKTILHKYNESPFVIDHNRLLESSYSNEEYELESLIEKIIAEVGEDRKNSREDSKKIGEDRKNCGNDFLGEIRQYCEWIGYDEDTAYVFLMRDSLLPYVFFCGRNRRENSHPWLISRIFLKNITKTDFVDDAIRLPLYEALELGHIEFDEFYAYCKGKINPVLEEHPRLKETLLELLGSISQKKIMVIESGYMGTIPMMLKSLDDRVDFRLFTTAPFLYETYRDKIFCCKYEKIRKFETVYSQDRLLQYSSYDDKQFRVNTANDNIIHSKSLEEIAFLIN